MGLLSPRDLGINVPTPMLMFCDYQTAIIANNFFFSMSIPNILSKQELHHDKSISSFTPLELARACNHLKHTF